MYGLFGVVGFEPKKNLVCSIWKNLVCLVFKRKISLVCAVLDVRILNVRKFLDVHFAGISNELLREKC